MVSCHTSIAQEKGLGRKRQNKRPKMGAFDRYMGTKWWLKDRFLGSRVSESAPIIVGGCGRSGTTLMWTILDTHPNICCGPESSIMRGGALKSGKLAMRFDFDPARIRAMARQADSQTDFIDRFFDEFRARHGKSRWAEKSPRNVHRLAFVREHFPNSRFIHVIRDGRDVICSLRTHPRHKVVDGELVKLNTQNPIESCIGRWVRDVSAGIVHRGEPWYIEVRYEDLVSKPEETLLGLFHFLEEPWDDSVLESYKVPRDYTKFAQSPEVTRPIYQTSMQRWRRDLSPDEIELFKRRAGSLLIELGYAEDNEWGREGGTEGDAEPSS
jgi:hypothetical protein